MYIPNNSALISQMYASWICGQKLLDKYIHLLANVCFSNMNLESKISYIRCLLMSCICEIYDRGSYEIADYSISNQIIPVITTFLQPYLHRGYNIWLLNCMILTAKPYIQLKCLINKLGRIIGEEMDSNEDKIRKICDTLILLC